MITKVEIKTIDIKHCKYDVELYNILTQELQNEEITGYFLSPNKIVVHVVNPHAEFGITVETTGIFHHPEGIYNQFLRDFPNVLLETIPVGEFAVTIEHNDEDMPVFDEVDLDYLQTIANELNEITESLGLSAEDQVNPINSDFSEKTNRIIDTVKKESVIQGTEQISNIMEAFDNIENGTYVSKVPESKFSDHHKTSHEKSVDAMKDILTNFYETSEDSTQILNAIPPTEMVMDGDGTITITAPSIQVTSNEETELSDEEIYDLTKIQKTKEMVDVELATISSDEFESYASKYHIIGWEVQSSATVNVKFIEGTTPESTIKKFNDTMASLVDSTSPFSLFNWEKDFAESVKLLTNMRAVLEDDTNVVDEFINRVKKHNVFVRESTAKIRSALIDMEKDFESLKGEVNLSIDWDKLTAFATKKERTEHRIRGVLIVWGKEEANVVKISSKFKSEEFYLPIHLLNDDIRENYTYEDDLLYIEDVPDFAFYEVLVNGYVMLIEKTDL